MFRYWCLIGLYPDRLLESKYVDRNIFMYIYVIVLCSAPVTNISNDKVFCFIHKGIHDDESTPTGTEGGPEVNTLN